LSPAVLPDGTVVAMSSTAAASASGMVYIGSTTGRIFTVR
jgi:hypothetical protein